MTGEIMGEVIKNQEVRLKTGEIINDPRLGRISFFDERSKDYPITAVIPSKKHRSYTWRCKTVLDQKIEGSCVSHGIAHELIARPAEVKGLTADYIRSQYWVAQKNDEWDGGSYPGANPFYEGTSILAGVKAYKKERWFESYRWAFSLNEMILGVGHNGPAVIGVLWYSGMFEPDNDNFIHPEGNIVGGHCVLVRAVNVKKKRFTIRNSWGRSWGKDGDCYINFDDMDKLLHERGECVFFLKRHRKQK